MTSDNAQLDTSQQEGTQEDSETSGIEGSQKTSKTIQEKIDKLTDQLFLVTNNKQYDALTLEIDHLKEKKEI